MAEVHVARGQALHRNLATLMIPRFGDDVAQLDLALDSKFICNKCKKQLKLDDICYCTDAKTKCHCNSRT
uniref:Uncharacterized protein n=1 Tax=Globodera rostochiensis TaxID=31243 RepID=A0A914GRG3_GLORO